MRVYNTLSGKKEAFEPIRPGKIRMYVCGPTVYDYSHIGHARSVIVFDVIARYFREKDFDLTYVRNFTDVDDKIIKRAQELEADPLEVAEKFIAAFYEDMDALNVCRADHEPRVTEFIEQIIEMVSQLVDSGHAYVSEGNVYYAVETFSEYGKLSKRKLDDMEAGARVDVDKRKKNPFDFALWKAAKPGEPSWESPWGRGRPGWHIECSAMSSELLGETFDIHGGGKDLIFPHHENEIAQSEGAFKKPFAKYWVHNGFINIDHEKMSKSLGNFLTVRDTLKIYHPEIIRLFLLSSHYRSPIDFTDETLNEASIRLDRLYALLERLETAVGAVDESSARSRPYWPRFCEAMDDDFNTAAGIAVLFDAMRELNGRLDKGEKESDYLKASWVDILNIGKNVLGILKTSPKEYFSLRKAKALAARSLDSKEIENLIQQRVEARMAKDWATADRIRDELDQMGIELKDGTDGTVWNFKT